LAGGRHTVPGNHFRSGGEWTPGDPISSGSIHDDPSDQEPVNGKMSDVFHTRPPAAGEQANDQKKAKYPQVTTRNPITECTSSLTL
jgi:hypothetical protein